MSLFNLSWRKYNLNDNPYFQQPLIISDGKIPMSAFIGRKKEIGEITKMIELGEGTSDHIKPWHEGGKTTAENCQMLCKQDNRAKSGK